MISKIIGLLIVVGFWVGIYFETKFTLCVYGITASLLTMWAYHTGPKRMRKDND